MKGHVGKGIAFLVIFFGWGIITTILHILPFSGLIVFSVSILAWLINVLDAAFNSVGQRY